ncbi:hypothetical protein [Flavobacterium nackdongense]|uniref:Uncharacterized protein n=1 Tax=Flavobacterium nackdongense TaxID=2547394 RepID=A0A4P6YEG4_9FLAO|nr:hypothetical protein [Flavobacterium nackdongense]QBN19107.1 hypothetical protein E1750_09945 [Flavobacterium nackdongense]
MKKTILLFLLVLTQIGVAQEKIWFKTYSDTISLVNDGQAITKAFTADIKSIKKDFTFNIKTVLHTTPYLIYFYKDAANIPFWDQVIPEQKQFFNEIAGSEAEGKAIFGLFFNGFYLPHELGHAFEYQLQGETIGGYQGEYFANTIAILWWRKQHREAELKQCYEAAKKMWAKLPNPIPVGSTIEEYFTKNYEQASQNPYVYGYMQFKQFIEIYENQNLPDFDTFIKQQFKK